MYVFVQNISKEPFTSLLITNLKPGEYALVDEAEFQKVVEENPKRLKFAYTLGPLNSEKSDVFAKTSIPKNHYLIAEVKWVKPPKSETE